jgi:hypothetical protein
MGTYYIFLSCNKLSVEDINIEDYLNDRKKQDNIFIRCISKHDDLESSKNDIDELADSSIYLVNTNEEPDYVTSWELGYAMGKGLKIIGYAEGENEMKIPEDMENLIRPIHKDINKFIQKINRAFYNLTPKNEIIEEEWNRQTLSAKKEFEGEI